MSTVATDPTLLPRTERAILSRFSHRRLMGFALPLTVLAYLVYAAFALDVAGLAGRFRPENAVVLLNDSWSYRTHVTTDNRSGETTVAIKGERRASYDAAHLPDWVSRSGETTRVALPDGSTVTLSPGQARFDIAGRGTVNVTAGPHGVTATLPDGLPADWLSASNTRFDITVPGAGRLSVTKSRSEVQRRAFGWAMWLFDLQSPFHYMSWPEIGRALISGPEIRPGQSNLSAMLGDWWHNGMWHHDMVFQALFETLLMAFLGTFGAAIIGLPLAFLAARNFDPLGPARFAVRRLFDFLRGVDGLIWTIILSRAFGPGPLTGSLAILLTDTGTFGKLFSESLENTDERQIEGLRSTGANALQRGRFGVLPQIAPVIVSQLLYMLESNTRGATVIGALVGGGIGLLLTQAMITQTNWEDVSYYIVLVLMLVMTMDSLSGWLRQKLLKGKDNA